MPYIAKERLYLTADRKDVVKEGDPRAAVLLVGEGAVIAESEAERLGITKHLDDHAPDALAAEKEAMQAAIDRGALYEAQSRKNTVERLEMARDSRSPAAAAAVAAPADVAAAVGTPPNQPGAGAELTPTGTRSRASAAATGSSSSESKKG